MAESFDIYNISFRNSHLEMFCKKCALKNSAKFTGKHLCCSLYFGTVVGLRYKRQSDAGVLLWILQTFYEHLFYRAPLVAASVIWKQNKIQNETLIASKEIMYCRKHPSIASLQIMAWKKFKVIHSTIPA